jgi:hypothetical protein
MELNKPQGEQAHKLLSGIHFCHSKEISALHSDSHEVIRFRKVNPPL